MLTRAPTQATICVDLLREPDLDGAVHLHQTVMGGEFLAGCGTAFLRSYYRAWLRSPSAIALAARQPETGQLIGLLLGSADPAAHYRSMVRRSGVQLSGALISAAIRRPAWGVAFLKSRGRRYLRGALRTIMWSPKSVPAALGHGDPGGEAPAPSVGSGRLGEITHLMVAPAARGHGIGRALVVEASRLGQRANLALLVVVTPPGWGAERFYARLGWTRRGEVITASHERFVRYELGLPGETSAPDAGETSAPDAPAGPAAPNRGSPASG